MTPAQRAAAVLQAARAVRRGARLADDAAVSDGPVTGADVLALAVRWFAGLPLRTSLTCRVRDSGVVFTVTSSQAAGKAHRARKAPVFGCAELGALAAGVTNERALPRDLTQWCDWKVVQPYWALTVDDVLDGIVRRVPADPALTIGVVLRVWGVELVRVNVHEPGGDIT